MSTENLNFEAFQMTWIKLPVIIQLVNQSYDGVVEWLHKEKVPWELKSQGRKSF